MTVDLEYRISIADTGKVIPKTMDEWSEEHRQAARAFFRKEFMARSTPLPKTLFTTVVRRWDLSKGPWMLVVRSIPFSDGVPALFPKDAELD